jgi:hypothetical protein
MDSRKKIIYGAAAVVLIAIAAYFSLRNTDENLDLFSRLKKNPATRGFSEASVSKFAQNAVWGGDSDDALDFEQKIAYLRNRYGKNIGHAKVQIALIEALWRHCEKKHPDEWIQCVQEFLYASFPDYAAEIFRLFEKYYKYQEWLGENRDDLAGLSDADRKKKLWQKRNSLFGQDASEEIFAAEIKNDRVLDTLEKIEKMPQGTVKDRVQKYKDSLAEIYSDSDGKVVERRQQEFMDKFLDLESVQGQLDVMPEAERKENLKEIRKAMGMDDAAVSRWDELDTVRDQRWSGASKYYQERESAEKSLKGEALEKKLDELRTKHFGAEGETIKSEEQSGYFRYKEKRKWGQN